MEHVREAARDRDGVERADRCAGRPDPDVVRLAVPADGGHHLVLDVLVELVRHPHAVLGAAFLLEPHATRDAVARVDLDAPCREQRLEHADHEEAIDLAGVATGGREHSRPAGRRAPSG